MISTKMAQTIVTPKKIDIQKQFNKENNRWQYKTYDEIYQEIRPLMKDTVDGSCEYDTCGVMGDMDQDTSILIKDERFVRLICYSCSGNSEGELVKLDIVVQDGLAGGLSIKNIYFIKHFMGEDESEKIVKEVKSLMDSDYL